MNDMIEMNLDNYENDDGIKLSSVYTMMFKYAYSEAFSGEGHTYSWFKRLQQHEEQLKRFKLECDMGLVHTQLRLPATDEHWTVPVIEGFMEYLATRHVIRDEEYGIDIKNIVHYVGARLADHDQFFARFLPKSIVTEEWIRYMAGPYANIVSHVDVGDEFMDELLEINPNVIRYIPENQVTLERAIRSVCAESLNIEYIPESIRHVCVVKCSHRMQVENQGLRFKINKMMDEVG